MLKLWAHGFMEFLGIVFHEKDSAWNRVIYLDYGQISMQDHEAGFYPMWST